MSTGSVSTDSVSLLRELERIAAAAAPHSPPGAGLRAVLATEAASGRRLYVCAFGPETVAADDASGGLEAAGAGSAWLVLDAAGAPVSGRREVRDAVALAGLCEIAADSAAGGDLDELLARLVALRLTEAPEGIEEAEEAVRSLQRTLGQPPQVASPGRLDEIGVAARRLEQALDPLVPSPFAAAMSAAAAAIETLVRDVESTYLGPLV